MLYIKGQEQYWDCVKCVNRLCICRGPNSNDKFQNRNFILNYLIFCVSVALKPIKQRLGLSAGAVSLTQTGMKSQ